EAGSSKEEEPPEDTDELIKKWRGARSYVEFEKTGDTLMGRLFEAGPEGDGTEISKILDAYLDASEQIKEEEFIEFISNRLDQIAAAKEPLDILLSLACDKSSKDTTLLETIVRLKGRAAGRVADRLAAEEDASARKTLNRILVRMGKEIIPQLIERLRNEKWYVVRNTVRNLGEIGESHGVEDALRSPLVHKDPRVRKETVRALSMIKGPETINLLKSVLDDSDSSVVELAVVSLGLIGDEGSVQTLIDLVENRADIGVRREAVRALGRIGSRKAVVFLIKTLEKKGWLLGKRDDDLKVMCVSALADAGTPDAVRALEAGLSSLRGAVRNACEEELRRIKHE
ncbi:MAG: HEAT-like repeat-containing protein, partial [Deltaproteobacteria bacterium]|nr:HEAT-like repeat-containing protein [Deltaproteobacteria bacterium]